MFRKDLERYVKTSGRIDWSEPSIIVIFLYRIGQIVKRIRIKPLRLLIQLFHLPFFIFFTLLTGIHIPRSCRIGPGLRIYHFGCIILNSDTIIGKNCTIRQGVTIGNRKEDHDVPEIGDYVDIGAGAKILGKIKIGNNVKIGANAVVITDVPDNCVVVGIPARIINK
jgi:serine O-acetyltransferase